MTHHSRRTFLRSSTALLSAAAAQESRARAGANDRVNLAFIGFGKRGNELRRAFETLPDVNMVAVADLYDGYLQNAREVINDNIQTTKEYRAILDRKDVDAVAIATPEHWHLQMVLDAFSAGKDIYCEKPMTFAVEEGHLIMEAAKKSDRILQIGSQMKTSPVTAKAREIIKSGVLGKINFVLNNMGRNSMDGAWQYPIPPDASPQTVDWDRFLGHSPRMPWNRERFFHWRNYWEYSGGIATDLFVHTMTTLHEILDVKLPKSAVANGGNYRWFDGRTVPDMMIAVWEYPGDFTISLGADLGSSKVGMVSRGTAFFGSEATMVLGGGPARPAGAGGGPTTSTGSGIAIYREDPEAVRWQAAGPLPKKWREAFEEQRKRLEPVPKVTPMEVIEVPRDTRGSNAHMALFIKSCKDRSPSVEDAECGQNASVAAHMANHAYLHRCKAGLDPKTGKLIAL